MNLFFLALRRSRFEDIQSARAPIAWCMVRAAPIAAVEGQCKYVTLSYTTCPQSRSCLTELLSIAKVVHAVRCSVKTQSAEEKPCFRSAQSVECTCSPPAFPK